MNLKRVSKKKVSKKKVSKKRFQLKRKNIRISKIKRRTNKKVTKKRNKKTYKRRNKNTYKRRINGGATTLSPPYLVMKSDASVERRQDRPGSAWSGLTDRPPPGEYRISQLSLTHPPEEEQTAPEILQVPDKLEEEQTAPEIVQVPNKLEEGQTESLALVNARKKAMDACTWPSCPAK